MDETKNGGEVIPPAEKHEGKKEIVRRWIFSDFSRKGVGAAMILSLVIFALYTAGSLPDPGFPDRILFLLLQMLRYASLLLCAFSLFALGVSVHRMVNRPGLRSAFAICVYFLSALLGAGLAMLNSFFVAISGGNV